jgi:hypothetical protein
MGIRKVASRLSVLHSEVFWRKTGCLYSPSCRELRYFRKLLFSQSHPYPIGSGLTAVSRPARRGGQHNM